MMDIEVHSPRKIGCGCYNAALESVTGKGAVKIAVDMTNEGLVDQKRCNQDGGTTAILTNFFTHSLRIQKLTKTKSDCHWLACISGAAVGTVVFSADDAETWHSQGKSVILVN
ncbi:hypothetical protein GBA52_003886 [Prunus armeniaca]|nr:hypothetical protein GBA52_003886 [Prunus armeniaca]